MRGFDDDDIIAGQATVAHELLQEIPDINVMVVPIGGGGLISGIAQYGNFSLNQLKTRRIIEMVEEIFSNHLN